MRSKPECSLRELDSLIGGFTCMPKRAAKPEQVGWRNSRAVIDQVLLALCIEGIGGVLGDGCSEGKRVTIEAKWGGAAGPNMGRLLQEVLAGATSDAWHASRHVGGGQLGRGKCCCICTARLSTNLSPPAGTAGRSGAPRQTGPAWAHSRRQGCACSWQRRQSVSIVQGWQHG